MLRLFGFLPPIGFYALAICALAATWSAHEAFLASNPDGDTNKIWLVGGILAFLLAFGGFQKSLENRAKASRPRVSSADVMQKLTPTETGTADRGLDVPPDNVHGPDADSPLGRIRARSEPVEL